jgi:hypothetical protein
MFLSRPGRIKPKIYHIILKIYAVVYGHQSLARISLYACSYGMAFSTTLSIWHKVVDVP